MNRCLLCRRPAKPVEDPRLPLLRVLLCLHCRSWVACRTGWTRRSGRRWARAGVLVEVSE